MKIAVVSDTHDNFANFKKIIEWLNKEKIKLLLHCGDVSSRTTIEEAVRIFEGEIKFVRGNADFGLNDIPETEEIKIENKHIALTHYPKAAEELAKTGKYDIVFYGHTHRPEKKLVENCLSVNPGEAAGQFYKPTFAIYNTETGNLELKILEKL